MILAFKCFCSWFQYQVEIVKVEQFSHDLSVKQESKKYYEILESIPEMIQIGNSMKWSSLNMMNDVGIQISLMLISIPGCDSKSWTISVWPFSEAQIKGVLLNSRIQFHILLQIEISLKKKVKPSEKFV